MVTFIGKLSLITVIVWLTSVKGFKFYCVPNDYKCTIENWNPSVDGYFLFQHIPNITETVNFINLQSLHVPSELCHSIAHFVDSLSIYDSHRVRITFIPTTCNILNVAISYTGLRYIKFEANDNLKSVLIKNSPLRKVPSTLMKLMNIEFILLEKTRIGSVDLKLFYPLEHLKILKITHSHIKHVSGNSKVINNSVVDTLKLNHNLLRSINLNVFAPFTSLTLLTLEHNKIETLSGRLSNQNLTSLLLNHNRLKVLDLCSWNILPLLIAVTVAYNNMTRTPLCLERFQNVAHLSLKFNQIDNIEVEQLIQLPKLVSINLSFNRISSIPTNVSFYPAKLKQLDLYGNPLRNVTITHGSIGHIEVALGTR